MPEKIQWEVNAQVIGGNALTDSGSIVAEAVSKLSVDIPQGTSSGIEVEVQPSAPGQVKFLMITATQYHPKLTYSVTSGSGGETNVKLDGPQVLIGSGAVSLLGGNTQKFKFFNKISGNQAQDVTVEIIVGRDATP